MALRVKYDIGTAVSVGLAIGKGPDGTIVETEKVYLPGAILPKNVLPRLRERLKAGDEHLNSIIEEFDGADAPVDSTTEDIWDDVKSVPEGYNPFTRNTPQVTQVVGERVDYTEWKRADLDAELTKRNEAGHGIEVTGTGKDGAVVAKDVAEALSRDDAVYRQQ